MTDTQGYMKLVVWQESMNLIPEIYALTKSLPPFERYGMADQMRRAIVSVAANIAEGHGREGKKTFAYFLGISRGSLAEVHTLIMVSERLGYINHETSELLGKRVINIRKLLHGLLQRLREN
jgi:four helix bundle protein